MEPRAVCPGWVPLLPIVPTKTSTIVAVEASDAAEPEVLMMDATDIKAHPTASRLNKGGVPT